MITLFCFDKLTIRNKIIFVWGLITIEGAMLGLIKDSYLLFFKKLPLWVLIVLPMTVFSFVDEYLQSRFGESVFMRLLGIVLLTLTELFIYKYAAQINLGNAWQVVRKTVIISLYQIVIGLIMMIPIYIFVNIAQHHQILSWGYMFFSFLLNAFIGGWFFAKANAIVPLLAQKEKISWAESKNYVQGSYQGWSLVSLLVYFPYLYSVYLIESLACSVIVSSLFLAVFNLFNALYYQSKK